MLLTKMNKKQFHVFPKTEQKNLDNLQGFWVITFPWHCKFLGNANQSIWFDSNSVLLCTSNISRMYSLLFKNIAF